MTSSARQISSAAESCTESTFTILYFAAASTFTRKTSETLSAPLEAAKLFDLLESKYKGISAKILNTCLVTVNLEYVDVQPIKSPGENLEHTAPRVIQTGDEVAIIPPVSSGLSLPTADLIRGRISAYRMDYCFAANVVLQETTYQFTETNDAYAYPGK